MSKKFETIASTESLGIVAGKKKGHPIENMSSLVGTDYVIEFILDKVMHIKYMQELERKVQPYVVNNLTLQGLKVVEISDLTADKKLDDKYLTAECQAIDEKEPARNVCDTYASVEKIIHKSAQPTLKLDLETGPIFGKKKTSKASEIIRRSISIYNKKGS